MRVLCTEVGQGERGQPGDPIGPAFEKSVNRTGAAEIGLHFGISGPAADDPMICLFEVSVEKDNLGRKMI